MLGIIQLLNAIYIIIDYKVELTQTSFIKPNSEHLESLWKQGFDPDKEWFILDVETRSDNELAIVTAEEKASLLAAMTYIYKKTVNLGECSFIERLLYIRGIIPRVERKIH